MKNYTDFFYRLGRVCRRGRVPKLQLRIMCSYIMALDSSQQYICNVSIKQYILYIYKYKIKQIFSLFSGVYAVWRIQIRIMMPDEIFAVSGRAHFRSLDLIRIKLRRREIRIELRKTQGSTLVFR